MEQNKVGDVWRQIAGALRAGTISAALPAPLPPRVSYAPAAPWGNMCYGDETTTAVGRGEDTTTENVCTGTNASGTNDPTNGPTQIERHRAKHVKLTV